MNQVIGHHWSDASNAQNYQKVYRIKFMKEFYKELNVRDSIKYLSFRYVGLQYQYCQKISPLLGFFYYGVRKIGIAEQLQCWKGWVGESKFARNEAISTTASITTIITASIPIIIIITLQVKHIYIYTTGTTFIQLFWWIHFDLCWAFKSKPWMQHGTFLLRMFFT